ncbi:MAG TPA: FliG C-terminal domain-containing protein [Magnetovibrio sp.]
MKISVKKAQNGVYAVSIDESVYTLSTHDLKHLLMEAVRALTPGALPTLSPNEEAHELGARLKRANDPGLQKLIVSAGDDDILIFLKSTEDDTALHEKLFANMSERKHKMLSEDLQYRFHDGVDDDALSAAVVRLLDLSNHMHNDGTLEFES